mmetsp:Transcript_33686/g.88549  ORF Transcript_33686/g.88549 Transcript_33686/m.88549 type:complete len:209 (-) Transcript_33686:605-1231(-)
MRSPHHPSGAAESRSFRAATCPTKESSWRLVLRHVIVNLPRSVDFTLRSCTSRFSYCTTAFARPFLRRLISTMKCCPRQKAPCLKLPLSKETPFRKLKGLAPQSSETPTLLWSMVHRIENHLSRTRETTNRLLIIMPRVLRRNSRRYRPAPRWHRQRQSRLCVAQVHGSCDWRGTELLGALQPCRWSEGVIVTCRRQSRCRHHQCVCL